MNEDADFSPMDEELELVEVEPAVDFMQTTMEYFLDAASVDAVYGQPIENGDTVIVPSAEVLAVLGFGVGSGSGSGPSGKEDEENTGSGRGSGGGGGGRVLSRPVAVIISSPEGVRVEPVVDVTKIGLAALTAGAFVFGMMLRLFNPKATMKELKDL